MSEARKFGQIEINGKRYVIDLSAYKGRDVIDFSPRASTPGGGIVMSTLGFYQPLRQSGWTAGFGFPWHNEETGYLRTEGDIDARHEGLMMRYTASIKSDSRVDVVPTQFLEFKGDVYKASNRGVAKFNDTTWSDVSDTTWDVNYLWTNGRYIFAAVDGGRISYADSSVSDSDGWTLTGANDSSVDYAWIYHHDGFVYAGKDIDAGDSHGNEIYYDDDIAMTGLFGNPTDDVNVIYAGLAGSQVKPPKTYQSKMWLPRADGLYVMSEDRQTAKRFLDYFDQADSDNFATVATWNGFMIYNIKDQLRRWNGTSEVRITPPRFSDSWPYRTYGRFRHLTPIGDWLFVVARTNDATYQEHLLSYDGAGWHKHKDLITGGTGTISALYYDARNNKIWYHSTADGTTNYIDLQDLSVFPKNHYAVTGEHNLITSRLDAGFRMVDKSTPSVLIGATNCDDSSYITVDYQLDADTVWYPWGGEDDVTNKVTSNGWTTLLDPTGISKSTLEYKHMKLKLGFETSDSTKSPVLEDFVMRLIMRPETLWGFSLPLVIGDKGEYSMSYEGRSTAELMADIRAARQSIAPIKYIDPREDEWWGYITSVNEQMVEEHAGSLGEPDIEERLFLNFVEVG